MNSSPQNSARRKSHDVVESPVHKRLKVAIACDPCRAKKVSKLVLSGFEITFSQFGSRNVMVFNLVSWIEPFLTKDSMRTLT